ncbi:MAG: trigger factor [Alphaproteobacteria bacterium]
MKIEEKKNKGLDLEWKVLIPSSFINPKLDEKYKDLAKNVKIPGFRPGKVPVNIIKKRFSQSVISEILDTVINENLRNAFLDKKIRPSVQPSVDIEKYEEGKDLTLNVKIQKMPEVKDFDLKTISLEKSNLNIKEEDINNTLNDIAKKHERFAPLTKKRSSLDGDLVLFDYEGKIDNKKFENGSGKDETVVLGSNKYIPGYEEQMVGLNIGDDKEIKVKFPDDYREKSLAGKDASFHIKIKDIQERVKKIAIDDQLAKEVGEKSLQNLKEKIQDKMNNEFKTLSFLKMRRQATEMLLKKLNFELPSRMVDDEINFLKSNSKDKKEKEIEDLAKRRVKLGVIISSISEKNKIIVEDSDLTKSVVEEAKKYPGQEQQVVKFYKENPSMMNNLRGVALEEKVMNFVVNSCKKIEKKCTMDELFNSDFLKEEKSEISRKKKEVK